MLAERRDILYRLSLDLVSLQLGRLRGGDVMALQLSIRSLTRVLLVLTLVTTSVAQAEESASMLWSRRRLVACGAALLLAGIGIGGWLYSSNVLEETPIQLESDGMDTPVDDPNRIGAELRELLTERGGSLRVDFVDGDGTAPVLRLFDKNRLQRLAAEKIKAAIQTRNPNVEGAEIGVGESGMAIRVTYFELLLQPDGMVRLAVGASSWRLESSRSYAPEELLNGSAHQMDLGPHLEMGDNATASFRAALLLRFDAKTRLFVVPHAKATMRVEARPLFTDEDSAEIRDIFTGEIR